MVSRAERAVEQRLRIVTAAVRCLASNGYRGATLEAIAEAAGMARGHIRHYAGNRTSLLIESARVFYFGEAGLTDVGTPELAEGHPLIPAGADLEGAFDYLFGEFSEPGEENAAVSAFIDAGREIPEVNQVAVSAYRGMERSLQALLEAHAPGLSEERYTATTYALLALALGHNFIGEVAGLDQRREESLAAARILVRDLAKG